MFVSVCFVRIYIAYISEVAGGNKALQRAANLFGQVTKQIRDSWTPVPCASLMLPMSPALEAELRRCEAKARQ